VQPFTQLDPIPSRRYVRDLLGITMRDEVDSGEGQAGLHWDDGNARWIDFQAERDDLNRRLARLAEKLGISNPAPGDEENDEHSPSWLGAFVTLVEMAEEGGIDLEMFREDIEIPEEKPQEDEPRRADTEESA
jgi:hypothetical protein